MYGSGISALTARSSTPCSGPSISSAPGRTNVPRPTSPLSKPAALRFDVRARHRRQRHAELACEDALRRQPAAGLQPAGFDLAADRVGDRLIDRAASLSPRRKLDCHACNMSLDCLQCQDRIHSISNAWRQCPALQRRTSVRFGTFELNRRARESCASAGIRIALQEQPLRILIALLERPGDVVGREELCRRLWPHGTFVDFEHSLNAAVRRLRVALGDEAEVPRFVETVHKRGYRFLAIEPVAPATIGGPCVGRRRRRRSRTSSRNRARLAVLPFGPYDGFTDGLTEEAITQLTQVCPRTIGVIARTSVERAQREGGGAAEIGARAERRLSCRRARAARRAIACASPRSSSNRRKKRTCGRDTFDRVMTDTLSLQTEVAEEIAKAVTDALSDPKRVSLDSRFQFPDSSTALRLRAARACLTPPRNADRCRAAVRRSSQSSRSCASASPSSPGARRWLKRNTATPYAAVQSILNTAPGASTPGNTPSSMHC